MYNRIAFPAAPDASGDDAARSNPGKMYYLGRISLESNAMTPVAACPGRWSRLSFWAALAWAGAWTGIWLRMGLRPWPGNLIVFFRLLGHMRLGGAAAIIGCWLGSALVFASAFALGRGALRVLGPGISESELRDFSALGLGLGLLSSLLLFFGLAGLWRPAALWALLLTPLGFGLFVWRGRGAAGFCRARLEAWRGLTVWEILGLFLLSIFLLLNILTAAGPEFFYDCLVYHLALPRLYLLNHRIIPTPGMIYSGVPFGTEMLYGLGLMIKDESVAKMIHLGFGLAVAALVYHWMRRRHGRPAALCAALLFYSLPMTAFGSWTAKTELALAFYTLLAALILLEAVPLDEDRRRRPLLALAGVLLGFAVGTKYNAALNLAVLPIPYILARRGRGSAPGGVMRDCATLWLCALAAASPWLVKNWSFYHNPVYPFFPSRFPRAPGADVAGMIADTRPRDWRQFTSLSGVWSFFADPWDIRIRFADNAGMAATMALPWLFRARRQGQGFLLSTLLGLWICWGLYSTVPRYFFSAMPIFCLLAAGAIFAEPLGALRRGAILGLCAYGLLFNLSAEITAWYDVGAGTVPLQLTSKAEYLSHARQGYPAPYYPGARFINERLPQDALVLFVGEARGYYCERRFLACSVFDRNPLLEAANACSGPEDLERRMRSLGVTHFLLNRANVQGNDMVSRLTGPGKAALDAFWSRRTRLIFEEKRVEPADFTWVQVYELTPEAPHG